MVRFKSMRATPNEIDDVIKRAYCDVWTSETISQYHHSPQELWRGASPLRRFNSSFRTRSTTSTTQRHFNARRCHPNMHAVRSSTQSVLYTHRYRFPTQLHTTASCPQALCPSLSVRVRSVRVGHGLNE